MSAQNETARIKYFVFEDGSGKEYHFVVNTYDPDKASMVTYMTEFLENGEKEMFLFDPSFEVRNEKTFISNFKFYPIFGNPFIFIFLKAVYADGTETFDAKKTASEIRNLFSRQKRRLVKKVGEPKMEFAVMEGIVPSRVLFSDLDTVPEGVLETWRTWLVYAKRKLSDIVAKKPGFGGIYAVLRCRGKRCLFRVMGYRNDSDIVDAKKFVKSLTVSMDRGVSEIEATMKTKIDRKEKK